MKAPGLLALGLSLAMPSLAIVGGETVSPNDYPFIVAVHRSSDKSFLCTGILITPDRVLTAADCIYEYKPSQLSIRTLVSSSDSEPRFYQALKKGEYATFDPETQDGDLGAMSLKEPVVGIEPVKFNTVNQRPGTKATLIGLGTQNKEDNDAGNTSRSLEVAMYHKPQCRPKYPNEEWTSLMDCAEHESGQGACIGDSGAPIMLSGRVIGIMTKRVSCGDSKKPDVVTHDPFRGGRIVKGKLHG